MDQRPDDAAEPSDSAKTPPAKTPPAKTQSAKTPTMEDVAARAGVSRALVSIVFRNLPGASPDNRERVRRAAEEIGFRPDRRASLLGRKRTNLLGVAFAVGHEFHADLISALYEAAAGQQLELVLSGITEHRTEEQAVAELLAFRCDALLLLGPTLGADQLATLGETTPVVVIGRAVEASGVAVVRTDDELGARIATEHLLSLGHRTVVHLDGRRAPGGAERRRGFLHAMRAAGLPDQAFLLPGGLTDADGEAAAREFLAERAAGYSGDPAPTAVFAFNDQCAIGFLATVRDAGVRIPADLSLIGYDDSRLAHASWTRLTTVGQGTAALAEGAVAAAMARIGSAAATPQGQSATPPPPLLIPPRLVVRATTAVP